MNFYSSLEPFVDFLHSIRRLENYLSFDILIPKTWGVPKSLQTEGQIVPFESPKGEDFKGISIVCEINQPEIDKAIQGILKLIKLNKEREEKANLFNEVVANLKKTFENTELDNLKRLNFYFENEQSNDFEDDGPTETIELAD